MKKLLRVFTLLLAISICLQPPMHAQEPAAKGWSSWWPVFAGIAAITSTYLCYKIGFSLGKKRQKHLDQELVNAVLRKDEPAARNAMTRGARANQKIPFTPIQRNFTEIVVQEDQPTELYRIAAALDMQDLSYDLYHSSQR